MAEEKVMSISVWKADLTPQRFLCEVCDSYVKSAAGSHWLRCDFTNHIQKPLLTFSSGINASFRVTLPPFVLWFNQSFLPMASWQVWIFFKSFLSQVIPRPPFKSHFPSMFSLHAYGSYGLSMSPATRPWLVFGCCFPLLSLPLQMQG